MFNASVRARVCEQLRSLRLCALSLNTGNLLNAIHTFNSTAPLRAVEVCVSRVAEASAALPARTRTLQQVWAVNCELDARYGRRDLPA